MKKGFILLMVMVFGLVLVNGVIAEETAAVKKDKPSAVRPRTLKILATVEAIDLDKRILTLKGPKGNVFDLTVKERIKNLSQVQVGDQVNVQYYEALAFRVHGAGEVGEPQTFSSAQSVPGEKPAGVATKRLTVTATVEAIDAETQHVTLKGPEGKGTLFLKVKDPKYLENVKVGDRVTFNYTQALAVSVIPVKKK
jgi:Cu/Ag efflux protein CusF